jgi:hypothetical protein
MSAATAEVASAVNANAMMLRIMSPSTHFENPGSDHSAEPAGGDDTLLWLWVGGMHMLAGVIAPNYSVDIFGCCMRVTPDRAVEDQKHSATLVGATSGIDRTTSCVHVRAQKVS